MKPIIIVGAGVQNDGNNANVTPLLPPGTTYGDMVLILTSIRNAGTGLPNTPVGWKPIVMPGGTGLFAKIVTRPADLTMPTISFTGGVAGATTIAHAFTIRQARKDIDYAVHAVSTVVNGATQNIATPALNVTADGCLILHLGWKQNSWTSVTPPAGDTTIAAVSSTLGSTAAQIASGVVQTTAANISASSFTVTGGVAAVSMGFTVALLPYTNTWSDVAMSEPPCSFPDEFNAVSNGAADALQAIDSAITYLTDVPLFRVSAASGAATVSTTIPYASVEIDPEDIVNLVRDKYAVVASRTGAWTVNGDVTTSFYDERNAATVVDMTYNEYGSTARDFNTTNSPPNGGASVTMVSRAVATSTYSPRFSLQVFIAGFSVPTNPTVVKAAMMGYWMSD